MGEGQIHPEGWTALLKPFVHRTITHFETVDDPEYGHYGVRLYFGDEFVFVGSTEQLIVDGSLAPNWPDYTGRRYRSRAGSVWEVASDNGTNVLHIFRVEDRKSIFISREKLMTGYSGWRRLPDN